MSQLTLKKNSAVRGGGGICPAKSHGNFFNINIAEAQDLARVTEGKERILTKIPDGFRLEATGLRVNAVGSLKLSLVRASIGTKGGTNKENTVELEKRHKAEWNGIHLRVTDGDQITVKLQSRSSNKEAWKDSLETVIDPLKAFSVQDQDLVWHPTLATLIGFDRQVTVWVELSLLRLTSEILKLQQGSAVATKQRQKRADPLHLTRDKEELLKDEELLIKLKLQEFEGADISPSEKVFMKDIWNKCLGWIEMTGEFIVEGLLLRCPDLSTILGRTTSELLFDMMVSIIDKAVRGLDERTEVIAREAYHSMPLQRPIDAPFHTLAEGFAQMAQLGMRPRHWEECRAVFVVAMQKASPYLEDADAEELEKGTDSCAYKFWNQQIMIPALKAIQEMDEIFENEENKALLQDSMGPIMNDKRDAGMKFYKELLTTHPELLPFFGTADMNFLAGHLMEAVELLVNSFENYHACLPNLHRLGKIHDAVSIPVSAYRAIGSVLDKTMRVHATGYGDGSPRGERAVEIWSALMNRTNLIVSRISFVSERLLRKAFEWSEQVAHELEWDEVYLAKRKFDIEAEIRTTGMYSHTEEEVVHGARVAWRNSAKCVGRIAWNTMLVRDRRHVTNLDHMFAECLEHQRLATADGSIKAVMTVFKPRTPGTRLGMRFWNLQLIRFACYEMPDGTFMGDKANLTYTNECIKFGWKQPEPRTEFDVLPIVIEDTTSGTTKMFEVPKEYHKVTMIEHPKFPDFAKLGLRWCVVPTVTCFTMSLGGLQYPCCPFNGWFMETEITRDLLEPNRMDKMEAIARAIGVDSTDEDDFWRERVALETNKAVVYSFRRDGHSIVDHVTAQAQFLAHDMREKREGRECPAQWSWVVPSFGGSTLPIWHHEMRDFFIEPAYQYQAEVTMLRAFSQIPETDLIAQGSAALDAFEKLLILYGSVTGTAEGYAYKAKKMLKPLSIDVKALDKVNPKTLGKEFEGNGGKYSALLVIVSTFGEGHPPTNAEKFFETLKTLPVSALSGIKFAVMATGSRVYPDFCQSGIDFDYWLGQTGGERLMPLRKADELCDQEGTVMQWIGAVASYYSVDQKRAMVLSGDIGSAMMDEGGPPVVVEVLDNEDSRVKEALEEENIVGSLGRFLPEDYILCNVLRNNELVDFSNPGSEKCFKSTRFLEFDLNGKARDGSEKTLNYETGDHAKIMPSNPIDVVEATASALNLDMDTWVKITIAEGSGRELSTPVARIKDFLSHELDLATQDKDGNLPFFQKLLSSARESGSSEELTRLEDVVEKLQGTYGDVKKQPEKDMSSKDQIRESIVSLGGLGGFGESEVKDKPTNYINNSDKADANAESEAAKIKKSGITEVMEKYMDISSIMKHFPDAASKLTLADLVEILPRHKPRYYSIASSAEMHPSNLQLTVGILDVVHKTTGNVRHGLCSHYLSTTLVCNYMVRMGINTSSFRLPPDMNHPVIMVGPGTGISPMLGFLQAREKALLSGVDLGPCMVFFGCRSEEDFLHRDQMLEWERKGVVSGLEIAFSRLPDKPKEYVQDRIGKVNSAVWELLKDEKCHYYICGDSNMAEDVYDALFLVAKQAGGLSHKNAWSLFQKMKQEHRFQADTWGVVGNRQEGLARQAEKKYNQAAAWLATVQEVVPL